MARILYDNEWYHEVSPDSLFEYEFEEIIRANSSTFFPGFHYLPFKQTVESEEGTAKPDFVLIDNLYRNWWIGEVELSNHSLNYHVVPQIEILANAYYSKASVEYIYEKSQTSLCYNRLQDMVKGLQPNVLVVVNSPVPEWIPVLKQRKALITIIQLFRSLKNKCLFRVNGDQITVVNSVSSECKIHPFFRTCLSIFSPGGLDIPENKKFFVKYADMVTEWKRINLKDAVLIKYLGNELHLPKDTIYVLSKKSNEEFEITLKE
jgi:hypothetical protein